MEGSKHEDTFLEVTSRLELVSQRLLQLTASLQRVHRLAASLQEVNGTVGKRLEPLLCSLDLLEKTEASLHRLGDTVVTCEERLALLEARALGRITVEST